MKILSRPVVKQDCEEIVVKSLSQMYHMGKGIMQAQPSMSDYMRAMNQIMGTLQIAGVLQSARVGDPQETKASTYENEEWIALISFSGDGTGHYVAQLTFNFRR